ncbi:unnamed protein product [Orchesella dallaii]|uniref:E3 ubiquitin-protein ligase n=1 Tax=Orchesella dallaii TaxID=48710 RepID=A0ABP1RF70_9HEXA
MEPKAKVSALCPTDPGSLIIFPSEESVIYAIFGCIRCKEIPNPEDYFICEKGHLICSLCAILVDPKDWNEVVVSATYTYGGQRKIENSRETCCASGIGKLQKGPCHLLDTLVKSCKWACKDKRKGCDASVLGSDWVDHMKQCRYHCIFYCHYNHCSNKEPTLRKAVKHLIVEHEAEVFDGPVTTLTIPFDVLIQSRSLLALIKWADEYFIFSSFISDNTVFMWMWNMQAFDKNDDMDRVYTIDLENVSQDEKTRKAKNSNVSMS